MAALRSILHDARTNEGVPLREVLEEEYVRRNSSQAEIDEIVNAPELIHACRENLWQTFKSGELDPLQPRHASPRGLSAGREDGGDTLPPGA